MHRQTRLDIKVNSIKDWTNRVWKWDNYQQDDRVGFVPGTFTNPEHQTWTYHWAPVAGKGTDPANPALETVLRLVGVTDPGGHRVIVQWF